LLVAGKTGTSDDFRDSWFAGFSGDRVAVVWIGYDDFRPTRLSGASGALGIWATIMTDIAAVPYGAPMPSGLESHMVDYYSGAVVRRRCADAIDLALPHNSSLRHAFSCRTEQRNIGTRTLEWLKDVFN
jgi:penicillin-binding protein 1B